MTRGREQGTSGEHGFQFEEEELEELEEFDKGETKQGTLCGFLDCLFSSSLQGKSKQLNEKQLLFLRLSSLIRELTELTERNMQRQLDTFSRTLDSSELPDPFFRLSSVSTRDPRSFFSAVRPELFVNTLRSEIGSV